MYSASPVALPRSLIRAQPPLHPSHQHHHHHHHQLLQFIWPSPKRRPTIRIRSLMIGVDEIASIAHNKVLVAATVASAIGQLSKPLTSAIRGKGIDATAVVQSGGMPSTHSASVVAATTSLGLERGFSDPIFGMSFVFAALVMYDAQGVRREVGYHAKILNKILSIQEKATLVQEEDLLDSRPEKSSMRSEDLATVLSQSEKQIFCSSNPEPSTSRESRIASKSFAMRKLIINGKEAKNTCSKYDPLNESVGHTEIQVLVGAILGFAVSLAVHTMM